MAGYPTQVLTFEVGVKFFGRSGRKVALSFFFLINFFIGVQLLYNVVLVSAVQQSESAMLIHTSTLF